MARGKKKTSPAECQRKFARTMSKNGKWRGQKDYAGKFGAAKKYKAKNARKNLATDFILIRENGETLIRPREYVLELKRAGKRFDIIKGVL